MQTTLLALTGILLVAQASRIDDVVVVASRRDVIGNIRESADPLEIAFQPLLDFDGDGCYQTSAIDGNGRVNPGHAATGTPQGDCRDKRQLDSSNTYSRKRCNNGYCAFMYEYYFEKDQSVGGSFTGGHRHDWENIVVFTKGQSVVRVAPSCHGKYAHASNSFPLRDKHPLLVYHKDGGGTHCFRFANNDDIGHPENPTGGFFRAPLVGWDNWPSVNLRNTMLNNWKGGVGPKLDDEFELSLRDAAGNGVPGFDPSRDS
ncbi:hypothetical protein NLG97_g6266 [Lecanicillium saksenae]|uniref:Uncharacterized protein n=1 Tax=Lecanicillium saksenae TaxID=468837 RepID=A0ACC1QQ54_9HYPO|nr:hypothetical protein NLG97_g6266 [Lecanicillium saksenae]